MKAFLKRLIVFLVPVLLAIAVTVCLYVVRDPYADFKKDLTWRYSFQQLGDLSTKKLLRLEAKPNSFILGSSRAAVFRACYLQTRFPGSAFYYYGNWHERIGGIASKIRLLDSIGIRIKNAVICIDPDLAFAGNGDAHRSDHHLLTGGSRYSYFIMHMKSFLMHLDRDRIRILLGMPVTSTLMPAVHFDDQTNDYNHACSTNIAGKYGNDADEKTHHRRIDSLIDSGYFYERSYGESYYPSQISDREVAYAKAIRQLLDKHHTRFFVIITPLYNEKKFAPTDVAKLRAVFGDRLFDFSGRNALTDDPYNYAEDRQHFRERVALKIIDSVLKFDSAMNSDLLSGQNPSRSFSSP